MKNLLFVNGCIRKESRTEKLSRDYIGRVFKKDDIVCKEVNVSQLDIFPLNEEDIIERNNDIRNNDLEKEKYGLAREFGNADIIVVAAPYWDSSFPSKLKVYFEHICVDGITFEYDREGNLIKKCAAGKLIYITTAGGYIREHSSVEMYMEELSAFFGINDFRFYCAQGLDIFPEKAGQILNDTLLDMVSDYLKSASRAVPDIQVPDVGEYETDFNDEELVSLKSRGFRVSSQYYKRGLPGSFSDCYVRKSVADMLEKAQSMLPKGIVFKIYDGYRPLTIQKALWDYFIEIVRENNPKDTEEEIKRKTSYFVSEPSYNIERPSLHNTGGAVDLSLVYEDGDSLDMGTSFDSFKQTAWTAYYEKSNSNIEARKNRRMLYFAMLDAGFTNLPSEWWHFDYGTKFWSHFTGKPAIYKGIADIKLPGQI